MVANQRALYNPRINHFTIHERLYIMLPHACFFSIVVVVVVVNVIVVVVFVAAVVIGVIAGVCVFAFASILVFLPLLLL